MSKFTVNFNLKNGKNNESLVIAICRWNKSTVRVSTHQTVATSAFDKNKQRCFTSPELFADRVNRQSRKANKILDAFEKSVLEHFDSFEPRATKNKSEETIVKDFLYDTIEKLTGEKTRQQKEKDNQKALAKEKKEKIKKIRPIQFFEAYIERKRIDPHTGRYIAERTKVHQRTVVKRLKSFLNDTKLPNVFDTFCSSEFDAQFTEWCYSKKNYKQNTIYATYGVLKPLLNAAKAEGIDVGDCYIHLKGKCMDVDAIYLTEDEIERIYRLDISQLVEDGEIDRKSMIEQTRDLFIIACWTALRRSDINNLRTASFDMEHKTISITAEKTKRPVVIPMHPFVLELCQKYNGRFPRLCDRGKTNEHLRECARLAGIDSIVRIVENRGGQVNTLVYKKYQLVGMHTGRRSFATNMFKRRFPTIAIMKLTGHTTEANFLKYIKITPEENAAMLAEDFYKAQQPFESDFTKTRNA